MIVWGLIAIAVVVVILFVVWRLRRRSSESTALHLGH